MAWTDLALCGEVVSAVKQHWGITRPDVTTLLVKLTNTDLPSAGFCFTAAVFHPHVSPNETRWSFFSFDAFCWLEINRNKSRILCSQKNKSDLVLCWVGLLEFVGSQKASVAVGLVFKCTLKGKLAFFFFFFPQTSTQGLNIIPQDAQCYQLVLFLWPNPNLKNHQSESSISTFSRLPPP